MPAPNLQMFRSDTPTVEIGTVGNPIDFGLCLAGDTTLLPYDIILWNDKGGILSSDDAYDIYIELIRLYASQGWTGSGLPSQTFNTTYFPVVDDDELIEVTVNGTKWRRVATLVGEDQNEVYTFNATTGLLSFGDDINGKIPPAGPIIITYTPDLDAYGKTIYADKWVSIRSLGIVYNDVSVSIELGTKIDDDTVEVLHYPYLYDVTGVWDNVGKTGTNYYTGGSFDSNTGRIILGTPLTDPDPYIEYTYRIKDDNGDWVEIGDEVQIGPLYRIPYNNAKRVQLKVVLPSTADPNGGIYLRTVLRITYSA